MKTQCDIAEIRIFQTRLQRDEDGGGEDGGGGGEGGGETGEGECDGVRVLVDIWLGGCDCVGGGGECRRDV